VRASLAIVLLSLAACGGDDGPSSSIADGGVDAAVDGPPGATGRWLMGYYPVYERDRLPPADIDFTHLSHLAVGRATPNADGTLTTTFDLDPVNGPAVARDLVTRTHAAGRTAILMLGGAGEHDGFAAAAAPARRARFVASILAVVDDLGFDGVDLDWEPLSDAELPDAIALAQALRAARPSLVLTMPITWVSSNAGPVSAQYANLAASLDQFNLMTYDMADAWPGWVSWHASALHGHGPDHPSSVEYAIDVFLAAGVPATKLGVGAGFYGACWSQVTMPLQAPGAGHIVATIAYSDIVRDYYPVAPLRRDTTAQVPYLSDPAGAGPRRCTFLSFEDADSVAAKGAYARQRGLGGAIVWTINQGHQAGAPAGQRDPLQVELWDALR